MPRVRDFRSLAFKPERIARCGRNIGAEVYWKLYAIENTIRIVIHSVLSVQINPNWWTVAVDPKIVGNAQRFRKSYVAKPQNASPGAHDIHLVFLSDLTEIMRANSHLISTVVPTTNQWIVTLEGIRLPRNLVGHMNFPNTYDRNAIDAAYSQLPALLGYLVAFPIPITIPQ
ncbi:MAG: hypothetical protein WBV55_03765 [Candidatus Sulfotelmatobacter sp.]